MDNRYINASLSQGDSNIHTINVPAGVSEVRVMVYWRDREGAVGANPALVNNLDITLTDPSNVSWNPWVLNPNSPTANATRGIDNLNNMEQVTLTAPAGGTYDLKVKGKAVPFGPQSYHVVYEFRYPKPEVTYPIGGESFVPGTVETVRWDGHASAGTYTLQYSTDNGTNWTQLASGIASGQRYFNWSIPASITTGQALFRVLQGTSGDTTDATFSIMARPANINVRWCRYDSLMLEWGRVTGADNYTVYQLGNMYMDSVGNTVEDSMMVAVTGSGAQWLSVSANNTSGIKGRRAVAISLPNP